MKTFYYFLVILLVIIVFFNIMLIKGCARGVQSYKICEKIRNDIAMCNFLVNSPEQKTICIEKVKAKYNVDIYKKCINES